MAFGELHPHILARIVLHPVAHGNYLDEIFFAVAFLLTLAVFAYYMLADVDEDEVGDDHENVE
jgi:hypothetical protein